MSTKAAAHVPLAERVAKTLTQRARDAGLPRVFVPAGEWIRRWIDARLELLDDVRQADDILALAKLAEETDGAVVELHLEPGRAPTASLVLIGSQTESAFLELAERHAEATGEAQYVEGDTGQLDRRTEARSIFEPQPRRKRRDLQRAPQARSE